MDICDLINKNKNSLNEYIYINKDNLDILKLGMHIKYTKEDNGKIYNGGFLIKIIDLDQTKLVNLILILKSNIIWNMRFIKYKIYGKLIHNFNRNNNLLQLNKLRVEYEEEINKSKEIINNKINYKLLLIKNNKHKYDIQI